jgi:GTP-binding protein YchF
VGLSIGIVGLPNAGKSSLFNALTRASAAVASYPFTTIEPHHGIAVVPDPRLEAVAAVTRPERTVPATVDFIDIAGLVRGASRGEGLGNQFLAHIREVHAIAHVVRGFEASDVPHVEGGVDPIRDLEIVEAELILADLATVEREIERTHTRVRGHDPHGPEDLAHLKELRDALQRGIPARRWLTGDQRTALVQPLRLLTAKPVVFVANVSESELPGGGAAAEQVRAAAHAAGAEAVVLAARLEAEAAALPEDESLEFLRAYGLEGSGLAALARAAYRVLRLVTFFSTASKEVRAWSIPQGTPAPAAAGQIHTDMERGFIRAEVINWEVLVQAGSMKAAHDHGRVRVEGKDYVMQDGDVVLFRFAV